MNRTYTDVYTGETIDPDNLKEGEALVMAYRKCFPLKGKDGGRRRDVWVEGYTVVRAGK